MTKGHMDHGEILALLQVADMAHSHGPSMIHIRNAALKRLGEIDKELASSASPPTHKVPSKE